MFTTIGIELTYTAKFCVEFYDKTGRDISSTDIHYPMAAALRDVLYRKDIKVDKCVIDPACVEVPTLPYKSMPKLMANIRAIEKEAKYLMLIPQPGYYCGGGAHIHAGIPNAKGKALTKFGPHWSIDAKQKAAQESQDKCIKAYAQRAQVIAAQNPWLCWAFSGINDATNAKPISKRNLMRIGTISLRYWNNKLAAEQDAIRIFTDALHKDYNWTLTVNQTYYTNEVTTCLARIMAARKEIALHTNANGGNKVSYSDLAVLREKNYTCVYRAQLNTMEFRAFLMPHNPAEHKRHIAIVQAIMKQAHTDLALTHLDPATLYDGAPMPYKQAKAGFHAMLEGFGLDPAAYRADLYRMALRARYMKHRGGLT
jgi:hypothetical protein